MNPLSDARRGNRRRSTRPSDFHHHHHDQSSDRNGSHVVNRHTTSTSSGSSTTKNKIDHHDHHPQQQQQQQQHQFDIHDQKKLQNAQDIWFRKSNIGYHCFVEYYMRQSNCDSSFLEMNHSDDGTETDKKDHVTQHHDENDTNTTTTRRRHENGGGGMGHSRAAKRRRKKLHHMTGTTTTTTDATVSSSSSNQHRKSHGTDTLLHSSHPSHPLLQAFQLYQQQQQQHSSYPTNWRTATLFFTILSQPLPITFRIRRSCRREPKEELMQYIEAINTNTNTNEAINTNTNNNNNNNNNKQLIHPMFQNDTSTTNVEYYQCTMSSKDAVVQLAVPNSRGSTNSQSATTWNDLLIQYSQNGCIARQELGSMLPVLALQYAGYFHNPNQPQPPQPVRRPPSKSTMTLLDMCSSPGSKLLQAVELMITTTSRPPPLSIAEQRSRKTKITKNDENENEKIVVPTPAIATGTGNILCVANDVLQSRLDSLRNAVQRSGIQTASTTTTSRTELLQRLITYTNQDATKFALYGSSVSHSTDSDGNSVKKSTKALTTSELIRFNIILCDVPCSGDGTCRKDKHILPNFTPNIGNALHVTQVKILYRALQLLHVNGCVCYSTCSLNPVEDEAVVAAAMIQYNNYNKSRKQSQHRSQATNIDNEKDVKQPSTAMTCVELVECPKFDNVKLRNGVSQWSVAEYQHDHYDTMNDNNDSDDDGNQQEVSTKQYLQWYDTYDDAVQRIGNIQSTSHPHRTTTVLTPTLWPPNQNDHADILQSLSKCQRLLPHDQDSGGFFIALIRKCTQG